MPEPPSEYQVRIRWRHIEGGRKFELGYRVIARNEGDAEDFGRYRFWKTHVPEISTIEDIIVRRFGVLLIDDGWGDADALGAHGAKA